MTKKEKDELYRKSVHESMKKWEEHNKRKTEMVLTPLEYIEKDKRREAIGLEKIYQEFYQEFEQKSTIQKVLATFWMRIVIAMRKLDNHDNAPSGNKWANNAFGKWSGGGRNKNRTWK